MNRKGFMMAELVVVSAIILVALTGLYVSYNKIFSIYNNRINYYDVATLYRLSDIRTEYRDQLKEKSSMSLIMSDTNFEVYYLLKTDLLTLSQTLNINPTYKEYLEFINGSVEIETDNILVMENCIDTDDCKYAYLEVYE